MMDDKSTIENTSASTRDFIAFATIDGHCGGSCLKFATKNPPPIWEWQLSKIPNILEALEQVLLKIDRFFSNYWLQFSIVALSSASGTPQIRINFPSFTLNWICYFWIIVKR